MAATTTVPFSRRGFRAMRGRFRRRKRGLGFKRIRKFYHNINIASRTLAANTSEATQLLIPADSPDHTIVGSFGTPVQTENNAHLIGGRLKISITCETPGAPFVVAILLYKDAAHGGIAAPATAQDVVAVASTTQLSMLKKNTCMYRKFWMTGQHDIKEFMLRVPRRMRTLQQGEAYTLVVSNLAPATDDINYFIQGKWITAA